ncbi:hypothetical protein RI367_001448 [Sorochytrium milnesiophthora]
MLHSWTRLRLPQSTLRRYTRAPTHAGTGKAAQHIVLYDNTKSKTPYIIYAAGGMQLLFWYNMGYTMATTLKDRSSTPEDVKLANPVTRYSVAAISVIVGTGTFFYAYSYVYRLIRKMTYHALTRQVTVEHGLRASLKCYRQEINIKQRVEDMHKNGNAIINVRGTNYVASEETAYLGGTSLFNSLFLRP